ncbi:FUSC family protein [Caballeronia sp. LZ062]|uniref:FUSC family protein n=1 Tax=unclassified Caballeronia TaxID=2646786 RepID=UPI00285E561E|nr:MULTISPECIES: FUSC family protein [unclassified Caballeronia]MDR5856020.1 FUSC family protein [Caballeronia sp. LZ050]MDR5872690.1 FUSC family protein [Caballeronia sp. LZ062]
MQDTDRTIKNAKQRAMHAWLSFGVPEGRRLVRTLVACAISYGGARLAALPEGYWALITTLVVVTQPSLTQALGTARDQITGACIGGVAGMLGVTAIQHGASPLAVFAVALIPLAVLTAKRPALRLACVTLVIVVLIPAGGGPPFQRPLHRVLEILIGAASAFIVAAIWPNRALRTAHRCVADTLECLRELIVIQLSGEADDGRAARLEARSSQAQQALEDALQEAEREHIIVPLQSHRPDAIDKAAPFLRRLHSDALFLGKAVSDGQSDACKMRNREMGRALQAPFEALTDALSGTLEDHPKLERARECVRQLKAALDSDSSNREGQDVAHFVIGLIVTDLDALIAAIYPSREANSP